MSKSPNTYKVRVHHSSVHQHTVGQRYTDRSMTVKSQLLLKRWTRVLIWHLAEPVVLRPSMRFKLHYTILSKLFDWADVLQESRWCYLDDRLTGKRRSRAKPSVKYIWLALCLRCLLWFKFMKLKFLLTEFSWEKTVLY